MGDYLGNSRLGAGSNNRAAKPRQPSSNLRLRIAVIALAALALGATGLIAQVISGDGTSPISRIIDKALSGLGGRGDMKTFTTVGTTLGGAKQKASGGEDAIDIAPSASEPADIEYGPAIVERKTSPMSPWGMLPPLSRDSAPKNAKDGFKDTSYAPGARERYTDKPKSSDKAPGGGFGGGSFGGGGSGQAIAKNRKDGDPAPYRSDKSVARKDDYYNPAKEAPQEPVPAGKKTESNQDKKNKLDDPRLKEILARDQENVETNRKIIRTGEMDFEVDSYEVAVVNITRLIVQIKGAFISDSKSGQFKSGKLNGYVVVRMPPQFLDQFILDLRRDLGKIGELKTQRINSQDVTKQFTDVESSLKAARTMEERLLNIIKTGKGEIKDLIAVENTLGEWRTKIEKMEGEMRYYSNQVSLSTLTISLAEREPITPFALVATENVKMRLEVEDVKKAHQTAEKAVIDAKGRVLRSELTQHAAGQLEAILVAELRPADKEAFGTLIEKLGIVSHQESDRKQEVTGGTGKPPLESVKPKETDTHFEVKFNNLVNIAPRKSTTLQVATPDVAAGYQKLHEAIAKVKGQVRNTNLNETDKKNITATIDFTVLATEREAIDKAIAEVGPILTRNNEQKPIAELATERKFGYDLTLINVANIQPREKTQLKIEVEDVDEDANKLKKLALDAKGRITDSRTQYRPNGEAAAILAFDVPIAAKDALLVQLKKAGKLVGQEEERFPQAPDNELAVAHIHVIIAGRNPLVPSDEGFGSYLRSSATLSFKIFATCVMLIIIGISAVLPWTLLIWVGYRLYCRVAGRPVPIASAVGHTVEPSPASVPATADESSAPKP